VSTRDTIIPIDSLGDVSAFVLNVNAILKIELTRLHRCGAPSPGNNFIGDTCNSIHIFNDAGRVSLIPRRFPARVRRFIDTFNGHCIRGDVTQRLRPVSIVSIVVIQVTVELCDK